VEPRLVPLLQRTFPNAAVVPAGQPAAGQKFATFEHLAFVFARDAGELAASFTPLRVDPGLVAAFRERYRAMTDMPLVGLSWGSKSHTKDVPDFPDWANFMTKMPATFVSLQYGPISAAIRRLRKGRNDRLIQDESVDQMVDMDRFAAQIAALDAVVTISNTAAHLAGALGVPAIFLIDDNFQTAWPVTGDRTPWYPNGIVLHKDGREWPAVLEEASQRLASVLARRPAAGSAGSGGQ
jgi:ADP-heptose:LPS heptosyltransferase